MPRASLVESEFTNKHSMVRADGERQLQKLKERTLPDVCPKCGCKYYMKDWDGIPQCINCNKILY